LIRGKNHQLGSQHQNFRKVRYLEPDIWTTYLSVGQPSKQRLGQKARADGMIIYQWRDVADSGKSLDDFIAYASFRVVQAKILAYLVAILAIGGVGGAVLNVGIACLHKVDGLFGWRPPGLGLSSFYTGIALGLLALLPMGIAKLQQSMRKR
jgi:hypothetical protein